VADFPSLSRRGLLVGAAGVAGLVTGCSADDSADRDDAPEGPAALAPDVAVATRALAEIRAVRTAVTRTQARFPATRALLGPVAAMHVAHERTLVDAVPDRANTSTAPAPYAVPLRRAAALRGLAAREQRLHDTLDGLSLRARSGDFARLLASMGAGLGQQLAGWES
jgi:hypothetical protein